MLQGLAKNASYSGRHLPKEELGPDQDINSLHQFLLETQQTLPLC